MKRILRLTLAGLFVATVAGCGGGGGGGSGGPPPPPPPPQPQPQQYSGGVAYALADECAYAVATIATRERSASLAQSRARQSCESTVASQPLPGSGLRPSCRSGSFSQCTAVAAAYNSSTNRCQIRVDSASTFSAATSSALRNCGNALGSACQVLSAACSASATPVPSVRQLVSGSSPPPPPPQNLPAEPARRSPPQGGGADSAGLVVAGAGTTQYVLALNTTSQTLTYQAGTWFEPKDGRYQRMIISRSTSVSPGQVTRIPTACMQRGNPVPASGARFYSRPKSISGSVQQCQLGCLSGSQNVQSCVWNCESTTSPPPPPPPPPPQPGQAPEIEFVTNDNCNDGRDVTMRFFYYQGSRFVNYATGRLTAGGRDTVTRVSCNFSNVNQVCYGARVDLGGGRTWYWGIDIDRSKGCTSCCIPCPSSGRRVENLNFGCPRN